ncbi:uncharacterized protein LOC126369110 [Pectinophora gossypiella]|uniref:uncharacterized protein LOC126369110 n=1 Tax=Pectinophora gossypiella TaxID=13191 RepID=UPI00214ECDBD|nr:uncharacterized protein LOC126369110 [Pectinophora gossypiella]
MELTCFAVFVSFLIKLALCVPEDPVMYLPSFEVRPVDMNSRMYPFTNAHNQRLMPQQRILHTAPGSAHQSRPMEAVAERADEHDDHNFTVNDIVEALNVIAEHTDEHPETRGAKKEFGFPQPLPSPPTSYPPYQRPYGATQPQGYGSYAQTQPAYHEPTYTPQVHAAPKTVKPLLSGLLKPVSTKVASKLSGLLGLVLALFSGSSSNGLAAGGLKDIIIDGIIKPLLIAKGGIKSLISKLSIPVISLLLINVEVLITIWWLWEECPEPTYSYSKPSYDYNNNNNYHTSATY